MKEMTAQLITVSLAMSTKVLVPGRCLREAAVQCPLQSSLHLGAHDTASFKDDSKNSWLGCHREQKSHSNLRTRALSSYLGATSQGWATATQGISQQR